MEEIRSYILSVTAAAILCAMVTALAGKGGPLSALLKLMTGVVMAAVVISPVVKVSTVNLNRYLDSLNLDAIAAVDAGTNSTREQTHARIKEQLESYILDKAAGLSVDMSVDVVLDGETMLPASVTIEGNASPYARTVMKNILHEDLGIPLEALTWK